MNRRGFLTGMAGILAAGYAPSVLPSGIIMPIRKLLLPEDFGYTMTIIAEPFVINKNGFVIERMELLADVSNATTLTVHPLDYQEFIRACGR